MKKKRLDRDIWGFGGYPYYQMRVDACGFHGLACLIRLMGAGKYDGEYQYWDFPLSGKAPVCGKGMVWLQLIPDGKKHMITAKCKPEKKTVRGTEYPYSVSIWYVDIIDGIEYDADGVAVFIDKYLDVGFTPQGDFLIDDRDELDEAFQSGELSQEQYDSALAECDVVVRELCSDIQKTETLCMEILSHLNERISSGERLFKKG